MNDLLKDDLETAVRLLEPFVGELRGANIYITGASGFVGCWLLETFVAMNEILDLKATVTISTRNPKAFAERVPHLTSHLKLYRHADVAKFTHLIHADPDRDVNLVLALAGDLSVKKFLYLSSGAIYGNRSLCNRDELFETNIWTLTKYGAGKLIGELRCIHNESTEMEIKIARLFTFSGPYLPLERFAIGNFVRDCMDGLPSMVDGDGIARRSYLYGMDMAVWLWKILIAGRDRTAYNVGSENQVTIEALACYVGKRSGKGSVVTRKKFIQDGPEWYVPNTSFARHGLKLKEWTDLETQITKMIRWNEEYKR